MNHRFWEGKRLDFEYYLGPIGTLIRVLRQYAYKQFTFFFWTISNLDFGENWPSTTHVGHIWALLTRPVAQLTQPFGPQFSPRRPKGPPLQASQRIKRPIETHGETTNCWIFCSWKNASLCMNQANTVTSPFFNDYWRWTTFKQMFFNPANAVTNGGILSGVTSIRFFRTS